MSGFTLVKSTLTAVWRDAVPEIGAPNLLTIDGITDTYARRMVGRAKRRFELATRPNAPAIANTDAYITAACDPAELKGFCFVAADEIASDLRARNADAKCVRVMPKKGGGDHYFTVVNRLTRGDSLIVDATWLQFALAGHPFCLAGTLKTLTATLKGTNPSLNLIDAYGAGLEVIKQWGSYSCF